MRTESSRIMMSMLLLALAGLGLSRAALARGQDQGQAAPAPAPAPGDAAPAEAPAPPAPGQALPGPPEVQHLPLAGALPTVPVRRGSQAFNVQFVDVTPLPLDPGHIWTLEFAFHPVRILDYEVPGKGRRKLHYLYYRAINHTGKPRMFVPQFTLVTDTGKRYEDIVMKGAVKVIQGKEDPTVPLLGAVDVVGLLPPSTKEGIDDAVYGVAIWEGVDAKADRFSVYVRGLSDGYKLVPPPPGQNAQPTVRYKTLRIDFIRRGDEHDIHSREIEMLDPPYDWVYW